ncbi:MFS transporter [Rothia kristinae]|uniref:MFS transporter n=1 Tax=Rothia kristinae TaxID=37923 RepID=UPI003408182B
MRRHLGFLGACLGFTVVLLDTTAVAAILPGIVADLGDGSSAGMWIAAAYLLAFAVLLMPCGALADRIGPGRAYLLGLVIFGIGSALCAAAPGAFALILARVVQGVGAAAMVPASLSLIAGLYAERRLAAVLGIWSAISGVAAAAGPVLAGALAARWGWPSVFWMNLPVCATALVLLVAIPRTAAFPGATSRDPRADRDGVGTAAAVLSLGLGAGIAAAQLLPEQPIALPLLLAVAAAILVGLGLRLDRRRGRPVLSLFDHGRFRRVTACALFLNAAFYGQFMIVPFVIRDLLPDAQRVIVQGYALEALAAIAGSLAAARVLTSWPRPRRAATGLLLLLAGLTAVGAGCRLGLAGLVLLGCALCGFGNDVAAVLLTADSVSDVPEAVRGRGQGVFNAARQMGSAAGVAAVALGSAALSGADRILLVLAVPALLGLCGAAVLLRPERPGSRSARSAPEPSTI